MCDTRCAPVCATTVCVGEVSASPCVMCSHNSENETRIYFEILHFIGKGAILKSFLAILVDMSIGERVSIRAAFMSAVHLER